MGVLAVIRCTWGPTFWPRGNCVAFPDLLVGKGCGHIASQNPRRGGCWQHSSPRPSWVHNGSDPKGEHFIHRKSLGECLRPPRPSDHTLPPAKLDPRCQETVLGRGGKGGWGMAGYGWERGGREVAAAVRPPLPPQSLPAGRGHARVVRGRTGGWGRAGGSGTYGRFGDAGGSGTRGRLGDVRALRGRGWFGYARTARGRAGSSGTHGRRPLPGRGGAAESGDRIGCSRRRVMPRLGLYT